MKEYEVVVVGGGIGGLTVAALLAQRGVSVCLLERQSEVGGCAASFDKFGFSFEQTHGLYSSWEPDGIQQRIFSELPVEPPEVRELDPAFIVRLPDHSEVVVRYDATEEFEENLRQTFPECADGAVDFYRELNQTGALLRDLLHADPDLPLAGKTTRLIKLLKAGRAGAKLLAAAEQPASAHLSALPFRFRRFIDAQLQTLVNASSEQVGYLDAALAICEVQNKMFAIKGGSAAWAQRLADSIRRSGGAVRLDSPVLRLAYDAGGAASGIDLLSGERIKATRAIVSNLTIWDTYGKLVGLNRTPPEIRRRLKEMHGWGAYHLFLSLEQDSVPALRSDRYLILSSWQQEAPFTPDGNQLFFNAAPSWDPRAPEAKRAVTVHAFTAVEDWFSYHVDDDEQQAKDQAMLEACWQQLHEAMPELGANIEVIETLSPRDYYETTRRKLGMVGNTSATVREFWRPQPEFATSLPNLFMVSDTTTGPGLANLSQSALTLANKLTS